MSFELNAEQAAAIAFEDNTWVSAGAGSGKTRALVELYIRLLEGGEGAERTVAITFTDKAASEMRERVRHTIDERLAAAVTFAEKERWAGLRRDLPRAPIGTIHAFCSRLLRENPAAAGVDPAYVVLEERESAALLEAAIERVVVGGVQEGNEAARALVETYGLQRAGIYGSEGVREAVAALYWQMIGCGLSVDECRARVRHPQQMAAPLLDGLLRALQQVEQAVEDGSDKLLLEGRKFLQRWHHLRPEVAAVTLHEPRDGLKVLDRLERAMRGRPNLLKSAATREAWSAARESRQELALVLAEALSVPLIGQALDLVEQVERDYRAAKDRRSALDFDDLQVRSRDLLRDYSAIRQRYQEGFDACLVDEFQDTNELQDQIVRLLCSGAAEDAASPSTESGGAMLAQRKLFVVGDPKQSIYGFRGADVAVFAQMRADLPQTHYLSRNYRSVPAVVDFINDFFEQNVLSGTSAYPWQVRFSPGDRMVAQRCSEHGSVQVLLMERQDSELAEEVAGREAELISDHIWNAVAGPSPLLVDEGRPARYGDCAILFRVSTRMKLYAHELQRRGIPYYIVRGQGFFECQEIKDIVNVLLYLDCADDSIALVGFLRSPMVGLSDDALLVLAQRGGLRRLQAQSLTRVTHAASPSPLVPQAPSPSPLVPQVSSPSPLVPQVSSPASRQIDPLEREALDRAVAWLAEWRELRDRLAPSELLERIVRSSGYLAAVVGLFQGEQKVANVRKLVDMARAYEEKGPYHFRGYVRYLTDLIEEGAREPEYPMWAEHADVVRLMTVHQSKGLEFPIVYVPQMARENRSPPQCLLFHPRRGVVVKVRPDRYHDWLRPPSYTEVEDEQKLRGDEEHRRLLYVAMTRAADHLVMSGEFGDREARRGTWARWLREYLGGTAVDAVATDPVECRGALLLRRSQVASALSEHHQHDEIVAEASRLRSPHTSPPESVSTPDLTAVVRRVRDFTPPPASSLAVTVRELAEYAVCARRHYYLSLLNLEEFPPRPKVTADPDDSLGALQKGILMHRILQEVPLHGTTTHVRDLVQRLSRHEDEALVEDVVAFLHGETGDRLRRARAVDREVPLQLSLRAPDGWMLHVDGVADLIFQDEDGSWHVVDYKQAREERGKIPFYHYQLSIYALALSLYLGVPQVSVGLQYLRNRSSGLRGFSLGTADLQRLQDELLARGRELAVASRRLDESAWGKVEPQQRCHDLGCGFRWRCGRLPLEEQPLGSEAEQMQLF